MHLLEDVTDEKLCTLLNFGKVNQILEVERRKSGEFLNEYLVGM